MGKERLLVHSTSVIVTQTIYLFSAIRCFTVKTAHVCPNFEVSCPTFEYRMRRSGNSLQTFAPNVPTFRQNVRANLANFIQDLFWRVRFSNEDIKTVEEGLTNLRIVKI